MQSYSATDVFSVTLRNLMLRIEATLSKMADDLPSRQVVRCHEVVQAFHMLLTIERWETELFDGHYGPVEHSWLVITDPYRSRKFILDIYSVGRLPMVQLLVPDLGHAALYRPGELRKDIRTDDLAYLLAQARRAGEGWK